MKFGLFYQLPCADGDSPAQRYRDTLDQIRLGDELGFDNAWFAELHFNSRFSITPSPLMLAAAAAETTQRIRLGVAVNLLPLHNPIRLAEDIATLDVLSGGRAEFGIGRGAMPTHFEGFHVPIEESRERFLEALEFIVQAWTNEHMSYDGRYFQARDLTLAPRPVQSPPPPCASPPTAPTPSSWSAGLATTCSPPLLSSRSRVSEMGSRCTGKP
jgi:alkanesulfonate monooxygenase SsuD/methylene tetrahydromethanopterin reductase-like flavin-dependent oxidoreductase (luciferase family)